jgi:FkbM family methyltransferase
MAVSTLGDVMNRKNKHNPLNIGVLKMDVEGFEARVIKGGADFLTQARIPFVVMEVWNLQEDYLRKIMTFF